MSVFRFSFTLILMLFCTFFFAQSSECSELCRFDDGELVISYKAAPLNASLEQCDDGDLSGVNEAKNVVKKFWARSVPERYGLFAVSYLDMLKRVYGITDEKSYAEKIGVSERTWQSQVYEKVYWGVGNSAHFVVLAKWHEEGYEGVMTFNFELFLESGAWKIGNIVY